MQPKPSPKDVAFKDRFEAGEVAPAEFRHRDHLRLAYVYLCENDTKNATDQMRRTLRKYLSDNGVPASKFHETLTSSWIHAVRHFMAKAGPVSSFDALLSVDDRLLDTDIMLTHYSREMLFSEKARTEVVPPDVQPIPLYS